MKKKKIFVTKEIKSWKKADIIVFSIILIWNIIEFLVIYYYEPFRENILQGDLTINTILGICILLFLRSIPFILIYYAFKSAIKKHRIASATFNASNDIEYYREIFKDINPTTMSLLMNLNLETNKDLGAMKLYYELNDIIKYDQSGNMYINDLNNIKLNNSDEILLNYFMGKNKDLFTLIKWKDTVIMENVDNGFIKRKTKKEKKKSGCWTFIIINILTTLLMVYTIINFGDASKFFNEVGSSSKEGIELLNFIISNNEYSKVLLNMLILLFCGCIHVWNIIASVVYFIASSSANAKDLIKRTDTGDFLAEKLYGMKNFIKDFSNLDETSKKHLVLWKDFLIYAVVLEENDVILKEISNIYHINLFNYKNQG